MRIRVRVKVIDGIHLVSGLEFRIRVRRKGGIHSLQVRLGVRARVRVRVT